MSRRMLSGKGFTHGFSGGGGGGFDASFLAWSNSVTAHTGSVNSVVANVVNSLIVSLKGTGEWNVIDCFWFGGTNEGNAALIDIKNLNVATPHGTDISFTPGQGWNTETLDATNYVATAYNAFTSGGHFSTNSASLTFYNTADNGGLGGDGGGGGIGCTDGSSYAFVVPLSGVDEIHAEMNGATFLVVTNPTNNTRGCFTIRRTDGANPYIDYTGVTAGGAQSDPSIGVPNETFNILGLNSSGTNSFTDFGIAFAAIIAGGLSAANSTNLATYINVAATTLGVNVF